jgi:omega-amidase
MKISVAQIACVLGDIDANVRKIRDLVLRAKDVGAELVVFPEMVDTGYSMPVIQKHATPWTEGAVPELRKIAQAFSIAIICGVSERDGASIYNSQAFVDPNGDVVTKYRKSHLFSPPPVEEQKCFSPGNEFCTFAMDGIRFALSICYDLRFPEMFRKPAVNDNANAFVISSAWPFPRMEHLRALALARAIENQSYVILSNRVGIDEGVAFCGSSAIIDPYGVLVAAASADREELISAELSQEVIASVRNRMPVFEHRRADLY